MTPSFYIYPGLAPIRTTKDRITTAVCKYYGLRLEQLIEKTRRHEVVRARQMCMYLLRKHTQMSLKDIGMHLGGFDHTTTIHSITTVQNDIDTSDEVRGIYERVKGMI